MPDCHGVAVLERPVAPGGAPVPVSRSRRYPPAVYWFVTIDWENPDHRGLPAERHHTRLLATSNGGSEYSIETWCAEATFKKLRIQAYDDPRISSAWLIAAARWLEELIGTRQHAPSDPVEIDYRTLRAELDETTSVINYEPGEQIWSFDTDD